jgi:PAS domain S-box-containing protein
MLERDQRQDRKLSGGTLSEVLDRQAMAAAQARIIQLEAENRDLKAKAERAEQLADVKDHALITMDLAGQIISFNAGASALLGYADGELLGQSGDILFLPDERDRGIFIEEMCWALEEGFAPNERWHLRRDGSRFWASGSMMPVLDGEGRPQGFLNVFRDNTALRTDSEHRTLLLSEMGYRVKNTLTAVQAVALQTLRRGGVAQEIQDTLEARLICLAHSHGLLLRNQWHGAALSEVVERVLLPYGGGQRINLKGPPIWLPANAVELLGLAFHELTTNATKYGALSVREGQIDVSWCLNTAASGARLAHIVWRERGGPPVASPVHRGFGSRLLEQGVVQELGGTMQLSFHPEGLECRICLPVVSADQAATRRDVRNRTAKVLDPSA